MKFPIVSVLWGLQRADVRALQAPGDEAHYRGYGVWKTRNRWRVGDLRLDQWHGSFSTPDAACDRIDVLIGEQDGHHGQQRN